MDALAAKCQKDMNDLKLDNQRKLNDTKNQADLQAGNAGREKDAELQRLRDQLRKANDDV